ncbi:MAG TPA: hypothetical protein VES95_11285 [Dermatophilaceae bacterium]|nr:hypothetical protein [Dermatophilaceae bacterium]
MPVNGEVPGQRWGWEDIDTVADLKDEPVTVVRVREARARLHTG